MSTSAPISLRKDLPLSVVGEDLIRACLRGDESLVKNLVAAYGKPILNFTSEDHGKFPLMVAVLQSNESLARLLITLGANVNQKTAKGRPSLPAAIARDNLTVVKLLVNSGAETEIPGIPLLDLCRSSEMTAYIESLAEKEDKDNFLCEDTLIPVATSKAREEPKKETKETKETKATKESEEARKLREIAELKKALSKRRESTDDFKSELASKLSRAKVEDDEDSEARVTVMPEESPESDSEDEETARKKAEIEALKEKKRLALLAAEKKKREQEERRKEEEERRAEERRRKAEEEAAEKRRKEEAERRRKKEAEKKRLEEELKQQEIERLKELLAEKKRRKETLEAEARKDKEIQILKMQHLLLEKQERKREEQAAKMLELEKLKQILEVKKRLREEERKKRAMEKEMAKLGSKSRRDIAEKTYIIVKDPPNWHALASWGTSYVDATCFEFIPPSTLDGILNASTALRVKKTTRTIKIKAKPFAKGSERAAFYMHDETSDEKLVAKEYFKLNDYDSHYEAAELQTVAKAFARAFNAAGPIKEVHFIASNIYHIGSRPTDDDHVSVEMWVDGEYNKFNNNFGGISIGDEYSATSQAFSHFTYQASGGQCCIVDIQGVKKDHTYYYTDPAIHTVGKNLKFEFHGTNFGQEGIDRFFLTHTCNQVCKKLRLKQHSKQPTVDYLDEGTSIPL